MTIIEVVSALPAEHAAVLVVLLHLPYRIDLRADAHGRLVLVVESLAWRCLLGPRRLLWSYRALRRLQRALGRRLSWLS